MDKDNDLKVDWKIGIISDSATDLHARFKAQTVFYNESYTKRMEEIQIDCMVVTRRRAWI